MKTAEAVAEVLRRYPLISKYYIAKQLGISSSTSINQWLRGTRMSDVIAVRFTELFGIEIDDAFSTSAPTSFASYRETKS